MSETRWPARQRAMTPDDPMLAPYAEGYGVLWRVMVDYAIIAMHRAQSDVMGIEMSRAEYAALQRFTPDAGERAAAEIAGKISEIRTEDGPLRYARPDPPLSILVVDRDGVRFAMRDGGYVSSDDLMSSDEIDALLGRTERKG